MSTTLTTLEESVPDTEPVKLTMIRTTQGTEMVEFGLQHGQRNIECVCDSRDEWETTERMRVVLWLLALIILYFILIALEVRDLLALGISLVLTAGILMGDRENQLLVLAFLTAVIGILLVFAEYSHI